MAVDQAAFEEPAFDALLEHVATWTPGTGDAPIRLHFDRAALLAQPDIFRGELFQLRGTIGDVELFRRPYAGVIGWSARDENDQPMIVFIDARSGEPVDFMIEDGFTVVARFYKVMEFRARDGKISEYPAFVGRFPERIATTAGPPPMDAGLIAGLIAFLGGAFLIVWLLARRQRNARTGRWRARDTRPYPGAHGDDLLDREGDLPDDPADALAVLRTRAASGEQQD